MFRNASRAYLGFIVIFLVLTSLLDYVMLVIFVAGPAIPLIRQQIYHILNHQLLMVVKYVLKLPKIYTMVFARQV